ncbi:MAG: hypothetical protein MUF87_18420 [Anaerolineae bacterium]|nr:hypothetical protein [Anaerolineae bacterium]
MEIAFILVIVISAVVFAISFAFLARTQRTLTRYAQHPEQWDLEAARDPAVITAIAVGDYTRAALAYHDLTGVSLNEAKRVIEYLQMQPEVLNLVSKPKDGASPLDAGIRELVRAGDLEQAITAYQSFTGVDESDARTEIERILWEEDESQRRSMGSS